MLRQVSAAMDTSGIGAMVASFGQAASKAGWKHRRAVRQQCRVKGGTLRSAAHT